jgi:ATP-dependent exoDNAse (exonuclease V) beta subunit
LLYVALTRAREKVIVEWPSHLAGKEKSYYWSLLVGAADMAVEKGAMRVNGKAFPCVVNPAETDLAPSVAASEGEPIAPLSTIGRRAIAYRPVSGELTPETVSPSLLHGEPGKASLAGLLQEETYGSPLETVLAVVGADRGLLLHKCFEVLGGRPGRVDLLEKATGMTIDKKGWSRLESAVGDFERWLAGRFQSLRVVREVPLLGLDGRGSVVSGVLDLLVETAGGYWILDHKSDITDDRTARFEAYLPQLRCYADLVGKAFPGKPVLGVAIHWISYGKVNLLPGEGSE